MLALLTSLRVLSLLCSHYDTALRPCHPCPVHTKNCSLVSWSGPACLPVSPARAPAAACCPSLRAVPCSVLSSSPLSSPRRPLWLSLLLPVSAPSSSSRFSSPFFFPFRWPRPRRLSLFGFASGFSVRLLLLLCAGGRRVCASSSACLFPRCCKLVLSTFTEHWGLHAHLIRILVG